MFKRLEINCHLLSLGLLAICLSCAGSKETSFKKQRQHFFDAILLEHDYGRVFDRYTQRQRTQSEYDITLLADVTLWGPTLSQAYVEEMARHFRLPDEDVKALAFTERQNQERYLKFVISATARDARTTDFSSSNALWRLSLEDSSGQIRIPVQKLERMSDRNEKAKYFYRRMNRFNETYLAYFPRDAFRNLSEIVLYITGPRGRLRFQYEMPQTHVSQDFLNPKP